MTNNTKTQQFLDIVPELVRHCIRFYDFDESKETKFRQTIGEIITKEFEKAPDFNYKIMFEEISERLEESTDYEKTRKFAYSLITPFHDYSEAFYGIEAIRHSEESIDVIRKGGGGEDVIKIYKEQIERTKQRNRKFFDLSQKAIVDSDNTNEIDKIFFAVCENIEWYADMIDAAFVYNHIDLKDIQDECGVCLNSWLSEGIQLRATHIEYYFNNCNTLALRLLSPFYSKNRAAKEGAETNVPIGINVSQLFNSKDDCIEFFKDGDRLKCADWAARARKYVDGERLHLDYKGDTKTLYDEIHKRHPGIAGIDTFRHTLRKT